MTASQKKRADYFLRSSAQIAQEARTSYNEKHFDRVVRKTHEAVELFLKGKILALGIEPAKTHDLAELASLLPQPGQIAIIDLEFLSGERIPSFYGANDFIPDQEYDNDDAERCIKILNLLE